MKVFQNHGYCLDSIENIVIDPDNEKNSSKTAIVTHAHSDHVSLKQDSYFMSKPTHEIIEARFAKIKNVKSTEFGKKNSFGDAKISLHNSGHVLGASQVFVEGEKTIAFTSDFKLQESLVTKPAEILKADVLVMESTFGLPQYDFPSREKTYEEMKKFVNQNIAQNKLVVLAGYSLGKAQELTAFANHCCNIVPLVHESIFENNKVYEKNKVNIGESIKLNHNLKDSNILIMPPSLLNAHVLQALSFSIKKKVASAIATGWPYRSHYDKVFPLSDHADFNQLLQYIKEAKPKTVLTAHGFAKEFAHAVQRKLKIPARELDAKGQSILSEFA